MRGVDSILLRDCSGEIAPQRISSDKLRPSALAPFRSVVFTLIFIMAGYTSAWARSNVDNLPSINSGEVAIGHIIVPLQSSFLNGAG